MTGSGIGKLKGVSFLLTAKVDTPAQPQQAGLLRQQRAAASMASQTAQIFRHERANGSDEREVILYVWARRTMGPVDL